jgi:hypothetical protein
MNIDDFDKTGLVILTPADLRKRLQSVRRGRYGAFHLYHDYYPMLGVYINDTIAYLHYFPSEDHPGFQPHDMTPDGCPSDVHFLQTDGSEADSIDAPDSTLVSVDAAYAAAVEFFHLATLPPSISWFEL